jgi:hypothetical protein
VEVEDLIQVVLVEEAEVEPVDLEVHSQEDVQ